MGLKAQSTKERQSGGVPGWASSESWFRVVNLTTADDTIHSEKEKEGYPTYSERRLSARVYLERRRMVRMAAQDQPDNNATCNVQQTTCNRRRATANVQPACDSQRAAGDRAACCRSAVSGPALARSTSIKSVGAQALHVATVVRRRDRSPLPALSPPSHSPGVRYFVACCARLTLQSTCSGSPVCNGRGADSPRSTNRCSGAYLRRAV